MIYTLLLKIILIILGAIEGVDSSIVYDDVSDIAVITSSLERNIPSYERRALHDLYLSTNGNNWVYQNGDEGHWNFTNPDVNPCSSSDPWQGLYCSSSSSELIYYYITDISLSYYNLQGTIPDSIGNTLMMHCSDVVMYCFTDTKM